MTTSCIILAVCHLSAKNYQNWWKFDEVMTKTILHSFLRYGVRLSSNQFDNSLGIYYHLIVQTFNRCHLFYSSGIAEYQLLRLRH